MSVRSVGCAGGATTGHPVAGQTLSVYRPAAPQPVDGNTGLKGRMIMASFSNDPSAPVVLRQFGVRKAIPASLTLPCTGTGTVFFSPHPSSSTAKGASVSVTYAS